MSKKFNYITNKYEEVNDPAQDFLDSLVGIKLPELPQVAAPKKEINPAVKKYLTEKMGKESAKSKPAKVEPKAENFEDDQLKAKELGQQLYKWLADPKIAEAAFDVESKGNPFENADSDRQEAEKDYENRTDGMGWAQFAAGAGAALAGRSPSESARNFDNIRANIKDETVGAHDQRQKALEQQFTNKNKFFDRSIELEKITREKDPTSPESLAAQSLAKQMMPNAPGLEKVTAAQFKDLFPIAAKALDIQMQREQMNIQNRMAMQAQSDRLQERREAKEMKRNALEAKVQEKARLTDKQSSELATHDKAISAIDNVLAQKSQWDTGKLSMGLNKVASWVGMDDSKKSAFKSDVGEQLAQYIKAISGATVSPTERASLLENVPSVYDNDDTFVEKANALKRRLQRNREIELDYLQKGGKNIEEYKTNSSPAQPAQPSSFPRKVRKGNQEATVSNEQELKEAQSEGFQ